MQCSKVGSWLSETFSRMKREVFIVSLPTLLSLIVQVESVIFLLDTLQPAVLRDLGCGKSLGGVK